MAEVHLDHPGEITWFDGWGSIPIAGLCTHAGCKHQFTSVIAWGPSLDRYELIRCGGWKDDEPEDCKGDCRAWVDSRGVVVTPWMMVDSRER